MHITGKVMNRSSNNVDMKKSIAEMADALTNTFKGEFEANGETFEFKTDVQLSEAKSMDDVSKSDHLVVLADGDGKKGTARGTTNMIGGKTIHLYSDDYKGSGRYSTRTAVHEFGHIAGLEHTDTKYNLMVQRGIHSNVTPGQLAYITRNRSNINKGPNYYFDPLTKTKIPYPFLHYRGETSHINKAGLRIRNK